MFKIFLLSWPLFALGCAAALVPASSNPRTKINQASVLFNQQNRPVGAAKLLRDAIPLAQKQNDKRSEADAEFYLAEIHKAPGPNGLNLKNPDQALEHYKRAVSLYEELKLYKQAAFVNWNSAAAYGMKDDQKGVCQALKAAEDLHEKPDADAKDALPVPYSKGNLLKSTRHLLEKNNCSRELTSK